MIKTKTEEVEMEQGELLVRYKKMVTRLTNLPKRIISLHDDESFANIAEFVLYDLCHEDCFNLNKAAFLVDNPDFNCMQGVAGFSRHEPFTDRELIWDKPDTFTSFMQQSPFNRRVRSFNASSTRRNGNQYNQVVHEVAQSLGLREPAFSVWDMKHANNGVLVYECADQEKLFDEHLINSLHLLSFCPVH